MRFRCLLLIPALFLPACTGFPHGWSEAKRSTPADPVSGAWAGTWRSTGNGHSGGLRAVATKVSGNTWNFRYRASWAKILCAGFSLDVTVRPDGKGGWLVSGSKDLGKTFGGLFTSTGSIRGGSFLATYEAKMDRGVMELSRLVTYDVASDTTGSVHPKQP